MDATWDPFREIMGIWPTIPITILSWYLEPEDEAIAALEHPDRVSRISLFVKESQLGEIAALMQEPFPVLTHLSIASQYKTVPALPDGFLGGSAPSLQQLDLSGFQYLALPVLLLSASNLVNLRLRNIPRTGYISPEAMVSYVAATPKLETLHIEFGARASIPDLIISPHITRTVLPALCDLSFFAGRKYIEDFVSRIDTPQLNSIYPYPSSPSLSIIQRVSSNPCPGIAR